MGISLPIRVVLASGLGGGQTLDQYLAWLGGWTLDLKFNEASGNIVNYGSDGGSGVAANLTYAQAGQLGAGEAVSYDGTTSSVAFANAAVPATKALTTQRLLFLIKATSYGEGNQGMFFAWGNGASTNHRLHFDGAGGVLNALIDTDDVSAAAITNVGQAAILNAWTLVFMDYDDANALGLGRKIRLITATAASAPALLTLATDTAATGTVTPRTDALNIGMRTLGDFTFAGLRDKDLGGAGLWSPGGLPADLSVPNRIRQLGYNV
jgi:hypothetical protein